MPGREPDAPRDGVIDGGRVGFSDSRSESDSDSETAATAVVTATAATAAAERRAVLPVTDFGRAVRSLRTL